MYPDVLYISRGDLTVYDWTDIIPCDNSVSSENYACVLTSEARIESLATYKFGIYLMKSNIASNYISIQCCYRINGQKLLKTTKNREL